MKSKTKNTEIKLYLLQLIKFKKKNFHNFQFHFNNEFTIANLKLIRIILFIMEIIRIQKNYNQEI